MSLNFDFRNWGKSCQGREAYCVRAIGVHEFGHTLGFGHEHNRDDAKECDEAPQGTDPDYYLTRYDQESVMNYCASDWNNGGKLTALDRVGVRRLYGPAFAGYDAAFSMPNGRESWFFAGRRFYRYDHRSHVVDRTGVIGINDWRGIPTPIDAALYHRVNDKIYFFVGRHYYRVNPRTRAVEVKRVIGRDGWKGVPAGGIEAVIGHPNRKTYFFVGERYYRYDSKQKKVTRVARIGQKGWRGLAPGFGAALLNSANGKGYFFAGHRYHRFDFDKDHADKAGHSGVTGWLGL